MKPTRRFRSWQRLVTFLSVVAVLLGSGPREFALALRGGVVGLAPAPLPELRAAPPLPPLVPVEVGEAPGPLDRVSFSALRAGGAGLRARAEFRPRVFALGGSRLLDGG
ncbi:hypothetical protein [Deinococcus pimensis]|uniref:hypothetical protein n=1 Tax=Deinococcus pimensis TaxID=309888 RepID=UPI0004AC66A2|nr:hypothetical protein [Deinococcus pimensis]